MRKRTGGSALLDQSSDPGRTDQAGDPGRSDQAGDPGPNTTTAGTRRVYLAEFCTARSGDKDDTVNIALFAPSEQAYELIRKQVTEQVVARHLGSLVKGEVRRYEVPNVWALNFVCTGALDGGAASSRRSDNLGKTFASYLLALRVEVDDLAALEEVRGM